MPADLTLPFTPRPTLTRSPTGSPGWPCPGCARFVVLDGEPEAEALADPLCCWCRPIDDPRLSETVRERRTR